MYVYAAGVSHAHAPVFVRPLCHVPAPVSVRPLCHVPALAFPLHHVLASVHINTAYHDHACPSLLAEPHQNHMYPARTFSHG